VTQGTQAVLTATINYSWTGNAYVQNVAEAEYYIDNPPWAGGTPLTMDPVDGNFNSPTEAVTANVDTGALSPGRHILLLRGRGVNDYSGLHSWGPVTGVFLDVLPNGGITPTITATPGVPTFTATINPSATPTNPGPTNTAPPVPSNTAPPQPTSTGPVPTNTPSVAVASATSTSTTPQPTSTSCPVQFSDVPVGSTFYQFIRCLACRGIINGYPDGTFKPNNNVTRGQLSKIVSNSAGFSDPATQMFEDVPAGSTFFDFVGRLASRGYISGYPCGGPGEPCNPPGNLPYFRPNANATRGQISKIVANAAGFNEPVTGQTFEDVAPGSTFYEFIERLASRGVMSGYPCGSVGEPCIPPENRPYFRPNNNATRGQTSKIVANTFFPACVTPSR
jgi:hypothetical protein